MVDHVELRRESLMRILAVVRGLGVGESLDVILDRVGRAVVDVLGFAAVVVNVRVPGDGLVVKAAYGPPEVVDMVGETMTHATWIELLSLCDRWGDLRFSEDVDALELTGVVSYRDPDEAHYSTVPAEFDANVWKSKYALLAPMWAGENDLLGVLSVDLPVSGRVPDAEQCALLELFAGQAGAAIAEAERIGTAQEQQLQYRVVFLDSPIATAMLDVDSTIVEVNAAFEELVGQYDSDLNGHSIDEVFGSGRALADDLDPPQDFRVERPDGQIRWAHVRLQRVEGASGGRFVCTAEDRTAAHLELDTLRERAERDDLTGLAVRSVALLDLTERLRGGAAGVVHAFLYCDLDRFKSVNDAFGHPAGDRLLTEVAACLSACAADGDRVCRIGGDEFAIVCTRDSVDGVESLARACVEAVAELSRNDPSSWGISGVINLSVGASVVDPARAHEYSATELVEAADSQLYRAKQSGGRGWRTVVMD